MLIRPQVPPAYNLSHLPSITVVRAKLIFPKVQTKTGLESFFRGLSLALFDTSSLGGNLVGHIKLYGEGDSKSVIRANVTGRRDSLDVEVRNFHSEKEVKVWLNVIAYKFPEDELRRKSLGAIAQLTKEHNVKVQGLRVVRKHLHERRG